MGGGGGGGAGGGGGEGVRIKFIVKENQKAS